MTRFSLIVALIITVMLPASTMATAGERIDRALRQLPNDVAAVLIVPSLTETSRSITQALEGMGRRELLLGARPIDHLKSITGVVQHVDDDGPLIVAWRPDPARDDARGSLMMLVPSDDPAALVRSNFTPIDDGRVFEHSSGARLHVRTLAKAVLLSPSSLEADREPMGDHGVAQMRSCLGDRGNALLMDADLALVMLGSTPWTAGTEALRARLERFLGPSGQNGAGSSMILSRLGRFAGEFKASITTIEFDPLAVTVRSHSRFHAGSPLASSSATHASSDPGADPEALSMLPSEPYLACVSIAVGALDFESLAFAAEVLAGIENVPSWLRSVHRAEFGAFVSPAGPGAGALNNAAMILATDEPARVLEGLKTIVGRPASSDAASSWETVGSIDGVEGVAAYRVDRPAFAPDQTLAAIAYASGFGPAGWQGYAWSASDRVMMTFSQRRGTVGLVERTRPDASLARDAAIRTMRGMIAHGRDVEVYLSPGRLAPLVRDRLRRLPQVDVDRLPDPGIQLPPIGFAAGLDAMVLYTTTILPADVVAVLLEAALQYVPTSPRPRTPSTVE